MNGTKRRRPIVWYNCGNSFQHMEFTTAFDVKQAFHTGMRHALTNMLSENRADRKCKEGCDHCCRSDVIGISHYEWFALRSRLETMNLNTRLGVFYNACQNLFRFGLPPWELTEITLGNDSILFNPLDRRTTDMAVRYHREYAIKHTELATVRINKGEIAPELSLEFILGWVMFSLENEFNDIAECQEKIFKELSGNADNDRLVRQNPDVLKLYTSYAYAIINSALWVKRLMGIDLQEKLTMDDIKGVIKSIAEMYLEELDITFRMFLFFNYQLGFQCPVLGKDKRCMVYNVRPLICATAGTIFDVRFPQFSGCGDNLAFCVRNENISDRSDVAPLILEYLQAENKHNPLYNILPLEFYLVAGAHQYGIPSSIIRIVKSENAFRKAMSSGKWKNNLCLCGSGSVGRKCRHPILNK